MQVHACREEKVIAMGGEKQDENDRGSNQGKMHLVFCVASPYFFAIFGYSKSFDNPV